MTEKNLQKPQERERERERRDCFIDAAKGLCVLAIIFVHSTFWSGWDYTPLFIKNISLLFDVPMFFFLTGCLLNIKPNIDIIKQISKIIMLFFIPVVVINLLSGHCVLKILVAPLFMSGAVVRILPAVGGSYWFAPVYVIALIYLLIITRNLNKFWQILTIALIPIYYIYSWFGDYSLKGNVFGVPIQMELFYIWLMLFGFLTYKLKTKITWIMLLLIGFISYIAFNHTIDGFFMQSYKFSVVKLPYFLSSFISIGLLMLLKKPICNLNSRFLEFLGNKALYFYLSQGISSSVLMDVAKHIHIHWSIKLLICYALNVSLSLVIGYFLCKISFEYYPKAKAFILNKIKAN